MLDEAPVKNNDNFEKLVSLLETYFKNGGTHFQLTYVSKEDLIEAQKEPEKYQNLQIRLCGWNVRFIDLDKDVQDEFILQSKNNM